MDSITNSKKEVLTLFYDTEIMEKILVLYSEGMAIYDISAWVGLGSSEVNKILDSITPYI